MAWIESHQSLHRHRKLVRAAGLLGVSHATLIGHLHILWWWALDNADTDGRLGDISAGALAVVADWPGKTPERFTEALIDAGFIDRDGEGLRLHDWYVYAGKLNGRRDANRERMKRARAAHSETHEQRTDDTPLRPRAELPNRTQPTIPPATAREVSDETEEAVGRLCREWERATGTTVTAMLGETFATWLAKVSEEWVGDAIRETGKAGAKSPRYLQRILETWSTEGRKDTPAAKKTPPPVAIPDGSWLKEHHVGPRATPEEMAQLDAEYEANKAKAKAELAALGVIAE
ncbi:MAG: DnaD domain protein [Chloroflexi bacterium]|nr:DnaD domain protein [Chloroflexota bacterium]